MTQAREDLPLALGPLNEVTALDEVGKEALDRDVTAQVVVARAEDLAHSAAAEALDELVALLRVVAAERSISSGGMAWSQSRRRGSVWRVDRCRPMSISGAT
jgi:hypothetical protein